jgi:mono/diheme cytochrome c family protein
MTTTRTIRRATAALAVLALALLAPVALAQDAASVYKSKCLSCHGPAGAGRPAIKGSSLLTDEMKKRTDDELYEGIASGGKRKNAAHAYEKKSVTKQQIQDLVKYVRELQQKK